MELFLKLLVTNTNFTLLINDFIFYLLQIYGRPQNNFNIRITINMTFS